jgi:hypothetical protein
MEIITTAKTAATLRVVVSENTTYQKNKHLYAFGLGSASFVGILMYKSGHVVSLEVNTNTHARAL